MRILFVLLRPKYVGNYEPTLRLLAGRGHEIHLTFSLGRTSGGRKAFTADPVERLAADFPTVTWDDGAPERDRGDGWYGIAYSNRLVGDLARYLHPRYADSPLLSGRVRGRLAGFLEERLPGSLGRLALGAFDVAARRPSAGLSDRLLRLARDVERAVPPSPRIAEYVARVAPDVVLVTPLVDVASNQVEFVKAASAAGIPSAICVASWDNLTNKGVIRADADRVLVWNEAQRREAAGLHGVPAELVVATGAPKFDEWFARVPSLDSRAFAAKVGLDPERPYLLYVCSSYFIAANEAAFVRRWLQGLRASPDERVRTLGVLVRPHPENAAAWRSVDLSSFRNVSIFPRGGAYVGDEQSRADFFDSLHHSVAAVGINTSAMIEAAVVGRPVYTVLDDAFAGSQEGTLHFRYLLQENGGPVRVAAGLDEHLEQLGELLDDPEAAAAGHSRFLESFVRPHGLDAPAAPILAAEIERLAATPARGPIRTRRARALHALLAPVAAVQRHGPPRPGAGATGLGDRLVGKQIELELDPLRRARGRIVLGPWLGETAEEVLYWVPFLRRQVMRLGLDPSRLVAVSHGGMGAWYEGLCGEYVDLHELLDPETLAGAFVGWVAERRRASARALEQLGTPVERTVPPAALRRVVDGYRQGRAPLEVVLEFVDLPAVARSVPTPPGPYVALDAAALAEAPAGDPLSALASDLARAGWLAVVGDLPSDLPAELADCVPRALGDAPAGRRRAASLDIAAGAGLFLGGSRGLALAGALLDVPTIVLRDERGREADLELASWAARGVGAPFSVVERGDLDLLRLVAGRGAGIGLAGTGALSPRP